MGSLSGPVSRRAAVLGHPIAHSLSPTLHQAAYESLGLDWQYEAIDVAAADLPEFIQGLDQRWAGLSLTMPLKEAVIPLLDHVDASAARLRSVNTVVFDEDGSHGYNTDVIGLNQTIVEAGSFVDGRALILGAGATARSAVAALAESHIGTVAISARRREAAQGLVGLGQELGLVASVAPWPPGPGPLETDLVVSTLPVEASDWLAALPAAPGTLVDVLYEPWPTPAVTAWEAAGGRAVGGLSLLVHQAVEQVRLMTGKIVDQAILRGAGLAALEGQKIAQAEQ
jgi:shikimate dehydrogenase